MLSYNYQFGIALIVLLMAASCQQVGTNDEDPMPNQPLLQISANGTADPSNFIANVGDTPFISTGATATIGIQSIIGYAVKDGKQETLYQTQVDTMATTLTVDSLEYYFDYTFSGKDVLFRFVLTDHLEQTDSAEFNVQVNESPIRFYENVVLGTYTHASLGNFYSILSDTAYFANNLRINATNRESVDFIVSFNNDTKISFSAPDHPDAPAVWSEHIGFQWPFQTRNNTRFLTLDGSYNYDAIVTAAQLNGLTFENGKASLDSLTEDQVFAFKLDSRREGKTGLMKVVDITGNTRSNRSVMIALKIQK